MAAAMQARQARSALEARILPSGFGDYGELNAALSRLLSFGLYREVVRAVQDPEMVDNPRDWQRDEHPRVYRLVMSEKEFGIGHGAAVSADINAAVREQLELPYALYKDTIRSHPAGRITEYLPISADYAAEVRFGKRRAEDYARDKPVDLRAYAKSILGGIREGEPVTHERLADPLWWRRQGRKRIRAIREHLWTKLHATKIRGGASPDALYLSKQQDSAINDWAEKNLLVMPLKSGSGKSVKIFSPPVVKKARLKRRAAVLCRFDGLAKAAEKMGLVGVFITVTCPSKMHPTTTVSGKRVENSAWDGTEPRSAAAWLSGGWARVRSSAWVKRSGRFEFLKVVEPHADGTPHLHIIVFIKKDDVLEAEEVFRRCFKARERDGESRFRYGLKFEQKRDVGKIGGYMAKYLAKSIGVNEKNVEAGVDGETGDSVLAWRRAHNLRSFSSSSGLSVIWQKARAGQLDDAVESAIFEENADFVKMVKAAKTGDSLSFDEISKNRFKLYSIESENRYGEIVKTPFGCQDVETGEIFMFSAKCAVVNEKEERQAWMKRERCGSREEFLHALASEKLEERRGKVRKAVSRALEER